MMKIPSHLFIVWIVVFSSFGYAGEEEFVEKPYFLYSAPTEQFINPIDSAITEARQMLIDILKDSLSYKPKIYIRDNLKDFEKLIGSAFPDWGAAAALPYREMIALKSPAHFRLGKPLRELVRHEYAHLALHHRLRLGYPPRWLDEGVAMYTAFEWGWENNLSMSRAVVFRSLVPLREIEMMNRFSAGKAQTAYAESYLAVKYFLDEYGREAFNVLLDSLRSQRPVDEAFTAAIGGNHNEFEKEFFEYLEGRYNLMTLFGDLYFLWIFLAVVVIAGFIVRYFRKKKYYKKWEEQETYESTDFDYGDPDNPEKIDDEDKPWL
jgi:hypothetical protein